MYIQRELEKNIDNFINDKEIIAINGPRQAGKRTLINNYLKKIKNKKINKITFENLEIAQLFEENIEAFIEEYVKNYEILFIDEIQYVKNSGQKLKFIYDTIKNIKIIITGSSATEISMQSIKYLVGRIIIFELQTLSFNEFLRYKDNKLYNICKKQLFSKVIINKVNNYIKEYITFGGYPRVVLEENIEKKKVILKNIFNTYLLKEISQILKYKESRIIERLVKFLSSQIGGVLNYNDLASKVGTSVYEIKNALYILEKTFVCAYSQNFHTNKQTELIKSPKIFFYDLGLRNSILNFFDFDLINGNQYENFIASQILRDNLKLSYWRTKSGAEVDFVVEKENNLIGIEIKTYLKKNVVEKSMRSFVEKYSPSKCQILSLDFEDKRDISNVQIEFLPYVKFLF